MTTQFLSVAEIAAASTSIIKPTYLCPVCGLAHDSAEGAAACASTTEEPVAKPGDLVVIGNGYAWRDGLDEWLYDNNGYKFHGESTLRFWFVITDVTQKKPCHPFTGDRDAHRLAYHVQTLGLHNGREDGYSGWTTVGTHVAFKKPDREPPASVVEASKAMVGRRFKHLL